MRVLSYLLVLFLAVLFVSSISAQAQDDEENSYAVDEPLSSPPDDGTLAELDSADVEELELSNDEDSDFAENDFGLTSAKKKTTKAHLPKAVIDTRHKMASIILSRARTSSIGYCAMYVRTAIQMAGVPVIQQAYAKQYGANLIAVGWKRLASRPAKRRRGDIIVFQPYPGGNIAGHIQMWSGAQWVSDFKQGTNNNTPWSGYIRAKSAYYRYYGKK
jgi:hypothetical protein